MPRHKYDKYKARDHRWGKGKMHRALYDKANRLYYIACRGPTVWVDQGLLVECTDLRPITCKRCLR